MKMVTAIIRPEMFDAVRAALETDGIYGMTVSEVMGRGAQKGVVLRLGGQTMVEFIPKMRIEMAVEDVDVDKVVRIVQANSRTGKMGDGRVFVLPIENVCRVRTDLEGPIENVCRAGTDLEDPIES